MSLSTTSALIGAEHALSGRVLRLVNAPYTGLPELDYPFHDKTLAVTTCGRICFNRQKINLSTVFAGQKVGIKQASEEI